MDEITRFRWQLIADETIDRAFAEAGISELLAEDAVAHRWGERRAAGCRGKLRSVAANAF
jgi:hypothetical protein